MVQPEALTALRAVSGRLQEVWWIEITRQINPSDDVPLIVCVDCNMNVMDRGLMQPCPQIAFHSIFTFELIYT
jgi:hypothetical protein